MCLSAASAIARAGSERGERRRGEDERWKEERALQQAKPHLRNHGASARRDVTFQDLGAVFPTGADVLQLYSPAHLSAPGQAHRYLT